MREPIPLSALGFGCAPVMGKVGKVDALRAMARAFDLGVTHFDVARSYGFGRAEGVLGSFIKGKRDKVTVTTKFGVVPPELSLKTKVLIPVARQVTKFVPQLKARLKSKSGHLLAERNFDVAYARQCLEKSLKELGTDYIDIFLVHEPVSAASVSSDAFSDFMEANIESGKIRRWGYALQAPADYEWAASLGGDVTQFEGNASTLPNLGGAMCSDMQRIVTRPFMGGGEGDAQLLSLINKLGFSGAVADMAATPSEISLCIGRALSGASGSVLCSMFSLNHIENNVMALGKYQGDARMLNLVSSLLKSAVPSGNI